MVGATLILTAENPGFQDLKVKEFMSPTDREAQLKSQALGVHLFTSYEPYELMVGLFLPGQHTPQWWISNDLYRYQFKLQKLSW